MSTRKAKDVSIFHQNRFASSAEFERGLLANLVAKRCALIEDSGGRELVWFIQHLSHQPGGLAAIARDLQKKFVGRIQTAGMVEMELKPDNICNAEQVRKLRLAFEDLTQFVLRGEEVDFLNMVIRPVNPNADSDYEFSRKGVLESRKEISGRNPATYPAADFFKACLAAAEKNLERHLSEMCLNPKSDLAAGPWYFPGLIETLREYQQAWIQERSPGAVTSLGRKVYAALDFCAQSPGLTLLPGRARMGKSFAARAWCNRHPGKARFVEVPTGNDEASFFRALARGLGLGNFLSYKVIDIRERVESVLLAGDIVLVFDEAQRLWPQRFRYSFPSRIEWVMTMVNAGVSVAGIATPQWFSMQKNIEKNGWNSEQLTGRIVHYEPLPEVLSAEDLIAVARSVLPEAGDRDLRALAIYARSSDRYLAAIDSISHRARYIATQAGRAKVASDDVRVAMSESVIPADTKLHLALESGRKNKRGPGEAPAQRLPDPKLISDFQPSRHHARQTQPDRLTHCPKASLTEA